MSLLSFLHPLWKRSLNEYDDSVNSAVIGALNQSLSKSEEDMVQSKVESYLSTADSKWLDYWGYWFGERRKSGWSDDYYRSRIVNHVEHARGTVDALRDAIADFINTNKDNIYIYEPYRDMFIWNSSKYNTNKYFSSTYYRYAVIDIQISASYPKEIVSIINLFRPAGVLWVLTETVNSRNSDAPIIDIKNPKDVFVPKIENDFIFGLRTRTRLVINPSKDDYETVTSPFTYNKKDSLFNDRNSLFMGATQISKRYSFIGQSLFDYTPKDNDTLEDSSYNVEQLSSSDIDSVATKNGRGKMFDFNPAKNNLISNASKYLTPTTISSYSQRYDMPTNYLKEGQTYNFAVNINSNNSFSNTKTDLILDSKNRNLYLNSKIIADSYGANDGAKVTVEPFDSDTNMWHIVAEKGSSSYVGIYLSNYAEDKLPDNSDWSYSADVKGTGKVTRFGIGAGNKSPIVGTIGSEWSRISQTGHFDNINYKTIVMYFDSTNSPIDVYIKLPKLEIGNTPTPWSPAPEDNPDEPSTTQIKNNLATIVKEGNQWLTTQFTIPEGFNLDTGPYLSFSGSDSNNTSPENQNMNNWVWSDPAKSAASITYAKGVNNIDYTGVADYEVFSMPIHTKVGNKVSVTFAYTQPSVVSLDGSSNGVPVSFLNQPAEHATIGDNPIYLGVNAQNSKVYTISTTATSETMYLSFNFGYLRDGINWKFELSAQQDTIRFNVSKPIIKSTANTNPMSWAQSADEETNTPIKLADAIDLKGFINDNYKTLSTTVTNKELNDLFDTKKLHLVIKTVNVPSDSLTIKLFNFNTNLWVTYGNFEITGSYTDIFVNLDDITPLMNANSLMYVSMEFSNDKSISVNLDYIGLSLSNSEDGCSIKMFADQSPYGIETQIATGPFIISKSAISKAYISPSRYKIGDPEYGKIGHYPLA